MLPDDRKIRKQEYWFFCLDFSGHYTVKLKDRQIGWFIGWLQKDNRKVFFVHFIEDKEYHDSYASFRSREAVKEKLKELISKELK